MITSAAAAVFLYLSPSLVIGRTATEFIQRRECVWTQIVCTHDVIINRV